MHELQTFMKRNTCQRQEPPPVFLIFRAERKISIPDSLLDDHRQNADEIYATGLSEVARIKKKWSVSKVKRIQRRPEGPF